MVNFGIEDLTEVLEEACPDHVVTVKRSIEQDAGRAIHRADVPGDRVTHLPFPLYQWTAKYVEGLATLLPEILLPVNGSVNGAIKRVMQPAPLSRAPLSKQSVLPHTSRLKLHEAIVAVLSDGGNRWMTARDIAAEIGTRGTYLRGDGDPPPSSQISARVRSSTYRRMFEVRDGRIRLRGRP